MIAASLAGAGDFFHSSTWYVVRNLAIFIVIVFWVATVYWVNKDARRRIEDSTLVWLATGLGAVPFVGPLIYMLFRPPEYIEEVAERRLEMRAMERRLGGGLLRCAVCDSDVEDDFRVCPVCATRLRQPCKSCDRTLEAGWQFCPWCETPVGAASGPLPVAARPTRADAPIPAASEAEVAAPLAEVPKPRPRVRRARTAG